MVALSLNKNSTKATFLVRKKDVTQCTDEWMSLMDF